MGPSARESQTRSKYDDTDKGEEYTWLQTVLSAETRWTFAFAVEFVACGIVLTFKCRKQTVETTKVSTYAR